MYIPNKFLENDPTVLIKLIQDNALATVITHFSGELEANHIPLFYTELETGKSLLKGHIAKANPLWKSADNNTATLAVFQGENCYISPNLYQSKLDDGKVVPTWNYITVHVKGHIRFIYENEWKLHFLKQLTGQHEKSQAKPWSVNDAPKDYTDKLLSGIVGFEIEIESLVGKWKVSQNQSDKNKQGIIEGLNNSTHANEIKMAEIINQKNEN